MPPRLAMRLLIGAALALAGACGGDDDPSATRSFAMGFTPWPYDATPAAVDDVYARIAAHGDLVAHHLDAGIPWQEALDGSPYPAAVEAELAARLAGTPDDADVYLALSPFDGGRTGLAGYWNDAGTGQPLPAPWDGRRFDDPEVRDAYVRFATDLIARFDPAHFNLGVEASELALNDPARFARFVDFAEAVSAALRAAFPGLKLMVSVGLKSPGSAAAATIRAALPPLVSHVDVVGASVYPYVFFEHADKGDPGTLPADWLAQIRDLAGDKPVAVAETGWIAERLVIPTYAVDVPATPDDQDAYVEALLAGANDLDAELVVWFSLVDFDALWEGALARDPLAHIWRDTGLYDGAVVPRPALDRWDRWRGRGRR